MKTRFEKVVEKNVDGLEYNEIYSKIGKENIAKVSYSKKSADFNNCYIFDLFVKLENQDKGIGSELLLRAMTDMFNSGCADVRVQPTDVESEFYAKRGFRLTKNVEGYEWLYRNTAPVMISQELPPKMMKAQFGENRSGRVMYHNKSQGPESCTIEAINGALDIRNHPVAQTLIRKVLKNQFNSGCNKVFYTPYVSDRTFFAKNGWKEEAVDISLISGQEGDFIYTGNMYIEKSDFEEKINKNRPEF